MKSSFGKSNDKTGSINAFDFDLGLGSGRAKSMNDLRNLTSSYASTTYTYTSSQDKPNTTSSWTYQPNKPPAWTHKPATSVQSGWAGSPSGPTSMVGDIYGKSWDSAFPLGSSGSSIGILNTNNSNLFADLLSSGTGPKKNSSNVPLKNATPAASRNTFSMGNVADSLPKTGYSGRTSGTWGSNAGNSGANVNLGGNYSKSSTLGGPSMKSMAGSGVGGGGIGSSKDPFGSLVDFGSKPPVGMNSASKESDRSGLGNNSFRGSQITASKASGSSLSSGVFSGQYQMIHLGDFVFANNLSENQRQPSKESSGVNDFDALFSSTSGGGTTSSSSPRVTRLQGMNSEFGGGNDAGGTLSLKAFLLHLPVFLLLLRRIRAGDDDGMLEALTCRASCYKEVGEYKKAVSDCTKVLEHDGKNIAVLVQRALLYESMEKYKLGTEDLRTVMNLDPSNRIARSTIHRLKKMAE
ncbi:hypothetical protein Salat_0552400 [Sesamum alatum]|uniref:Uncharacterized protein n=1 Tax=Sesamum alatum TaxID=300844 RepID=A0AAE1YPR2_9LAMI|nr:hypothetical protein Salat_0552400 [Sesamum alatum]